MIGRTLSHYKIIAKLGEGGMGVVYKAQDTRLDRLVALKFLPPSLLASDTDLLRFQQEAKVLSALNHPHIATLYDIYQTGEEAFIALEYLSGGTLRSQVKDALASGRELPIDQILRYGIQIAEGLAHAHRRGIVHRDLKTDNLMLTEEGSVKITDFGLARFAGSAQLTKTGSTVGTAAYMSPEQIRGEEADGRSDIFSLGVVLYELLTGRLPFRGEHAAAISYSIAHEEPIAIALLRPQVPPSLAAAIMRCLEKEKADRFATADELVAVFRSVATAADQPRPAPTKRRLPLKKISFAALGLVLVGLVVVTVLLRPSGDEVDRSSIAVLPLQNMSEERENEYFSDGITEDIIAQLSTIGGLKVISRTSVMRYKNTTKPLRDIGRELNVAVILEGSVRRSGNRIRIVGQLFDARTDESLWAQTYDRELTEIFDIQSDVAKDIAQAVKAELSQAEKQRIERRPTASFEAYQLYLRGRSHIERTAREDILQAADLYRQAIAIDSNYALAYAGLSECYSYMAYFQYDVLPLAEARQKAKSSALRALEIDPELAEGYAMLGYYRRTSEWDWKGAEADFKRAIELKPNHAVAHHYYALLLTTLGRFDEALYQEEIARTLSPLGLDINLVYGRILYYSRQYDRAIEQLKQTVELDASFLKARGLLGHVYELKGMHAEAVAEFVVARSLTGIDFEGTDNYPPVKATGGAEEYWKEALEVAKEFSRREPVSGLVMAVLYARVGELDNAVEWLKYAYERREGGLVYLAVEPAFDPLRNEPGFREIVKKMGLLE